MDSRNHYKTNNKINMARFKDNLEKQEVQKEWSDAEMEKFHTYITTEVRKKLQNLSKDSRMAVKSLEYMWYVIEGAMVIREYMGTKDVRIVVKRNHKGDIIEAPWEKLKYKWKAYDKWLDKKRFIISKKVEGVEKLYGREIQTKIA